MPKYLKNRTHAPTKLKRNTKPINNNDYIMYHGTTKRKAQKIKNQGFKRSKNGMLGPGVYVSRDIRKASRYPIRAKPENRVVLKLLVNVGKVKVINKQGHPMQKNWHKHGYDAAWVPPKCGMVKSGLQEDCIWDPKRIKVLGILDPDELSDYFDGEDDEDDDYDEGDNEEWCEDDED